MRSSEAMSLLTCRRDHDEPTPRFIGTPNMRRYPMTGYSRFEFWSEMARKHS
jgi:hypothetical protein